MKPAIAALLALALSACASGPPKEGIAPAPLCTSDADCAIKWAAARTFVLQNAGYKIQTYSADFFQTFSPVGSDARLGAEVNKQPAPGGGYLIVAKFWCDNMFGCVPNQWKTLDAFNRTVAAAH